MKSTVFLWFLSSQWKLWVSCVSLPSLRLCGSFFYWEMKVNKLDFWVCLWGVMQGVELYQPKLPRAVVTIKIKLTIVFCFFVGGKLTFSVQSHLLVADEVFPIWNEGKSLLVCLSVPEHWKRTRCVFPGLSLVSHCGAWIVEVKSEAVKAAIQTWHISFKRYKVHVFVRNVLFYCFWCILYISALWYCS